MALTDVMWFNEEGSALTEQSVCRDFPLLSCTYSSMLGISA
jgi:hypothetical protein